MFRITLRYFFPRHPLPENGIQLENHNSNLHLHAHEYITKTCKYRLPAFLNSNNNNYGKSEILRNIIDDIDNNTFAKFKSVTKRYMINKHSYYCNICNCYICQL